MSQPTFPRCWREETKPHKFCPGCGHGMVLRALGEVIDDLKIQDQTILGVDIGCSLLAWDFFDLDTIQTHHGRTTPVMVGIKMAQPDRIVIAYMGDGGGYAIGAQHLVNTAVRDDPVFVILINNANYGMTGGQQAPTTIPGQITETTPYGRKQTFLLGPEMVRTINKKAYIARALATQFIPLKQMVQKAIAHQLNKNGFSFLEVVSPCPTNWRTDAQKTLAYLETLKEKFPIGDL